MQNTNEKQNKKWWNYRQMSSKDYGRIAILGLLLAGLKDLFPRPGPFIEILLNILIAWGGIAGIFWIREKIKSRNKKV